MATDGPQPRIRLAPAVDRWLERTAGGKEKRAAYVRMLIEQAMRRQQEEADLAMFDRAAEDLTGDDLEEREDLLGGFSMGEE